MELIDRISGLEEEMGMVKSEIKKVLIDLRETMNTAENPFAHIEQLRGVGGSGVDEERMKTLEAALEGLQELIGEERLQKLEEALEELKELDGGSGVDEERMKTLEDAIEGLKGLDGGSGIDEERLKNLEDAIGGLQELIGEERLKNLEDAVDELKEMGSEQEIDEEQLQNVEDAVDEPKIIGIDSSEDDEMILKKLEDCICKLDELGDAEMARLKNLDLVIEKLGEAKVEQPQPENPVALNLVAPEAVSPEAVSPESELGGQELELLGPENESGTDNRIIGPLTLSQLIQWADRTLNLIGVENLKYVVDLYELTGRLSKEMKEAILKITELPSASVTPENEHVETKCYIIALFELNKILTGENHELITLLKDLSGENHELISLLKDLY